jgi:hypothetical protein
MSTFLLDLLAPEASGGALADFSFFSVALRRSEGLEQGHPSKALSDRTVDDVGLRMKLRELA